MNKSNLKLVKVESIVMRRDFWWVRLRFCKTGAFLWKKSNLKTGWWQSRTHQNTRLLERNNLCVNTFRTLFGVFFVWCKLVRCVGEKTTCFRRPQLLESSLLLLLHSGRVGKRLVTLCKFSPYYIGNVRAGTPRQVNWHSLLGGGGVGVVWRNVKNVIKTN